MRANPMLSIHLSIAIGAGIMVHLHGRPSHIMRGPYHWGGQNAEEAHQQD